MIRPLIDEIVLFLVPFAAFALWLIVRRKAPHDLAHWAGRGPMLTLIGLLLVAAGLAWTGFTAERDLGAYVPANIENGRLVPGSFK
jgi:hypothetical protein